MRALWQRYGAGPGHLLGSAACLAIAAAAVVGWFDTPSSVVNVLIWFVAAILLHDLVVLPLYSLADRLMHLKLPVHAGTYLRIPLLIAGLVLAATFPTVLGFGAHSTGRLTGIPEHGYLARWLILLGVLLVLSGLLYAVRRPKVDAQ